MIATRRLSITSAIVVVLASALFAKEPTLLNVRKIWDKAPHNGFTDLIRFQDQWFCIFRESSGHMARDGKVRILHSEDGETWTSAALLEIAGQDLREAKFSITPDQRLMLSGAVALPPNGEGGHQSLN